MGTATATTMTLSAFNAHMGWKGRYVYELKKAGRLVMSEDGKHVLVAESIARVEATRDPSRAGVAQRHADNRGYFVSCERLQSNESMEKNSKNEIVESVGSYQFQEAKAKREHYAALREEAAYRKEAGELMPSSEVIGIFSDAAAKLAGILDAVPATVGPLLAGLGQEDILRILTEQMDVARAEMAGALHKLTEEIKDRQKGAAAA